MTTFTHSSDARRPSLGSPLTLPCGAVVPNRFFKAAMNEALGDRHGRPTGLLPRLYRRWAQGGAGLLVTGNVMIDPAHTGEPGNVVVEDERDLEALTAWAQAGRSNGGHVWLQLNHPGRQSPRSINRQPVAPSAVALPGMERFFAPPRALSIDEIAEVVRRFATTAAVAKRAGFTGVEIHAAHGYLLSQFLSPAANVRTDQYGGSLENRARLLLEVTAAVRAQVGDDFPVGVKLNSSDGDPHGFQEADALRVAAWLSEAGVDLIDISGGTYTTTSMRSGPGSGGGFFTQFGKEIGSSVTAPVVLSGGFRSIEAMAETVEDDIAQMVGLARPLVVEPDLPRQVLAGEQPSTVTLPRVTIGNARLDKAIQAPLVNTFYETQMRRLAQGKPPLGSTRSASGWPAIAFALRLHGPAVLAPRRATHTR